MHTLLTAIDKLSALPMDARVKAYNSITQAVHKMLGFARDHPCLAPQLIKQEKVVGNDYNPNKVAPPEMALLRLSIRRDGLTMPVVVDFSGETAIVVDGFHRTHVCQQDKAVASDLAGYIPCSILNKSIDDRMASTVRHNMARGSHQTILSAELITLLKKHNWSDQKIGKELGMDPDEILRLKQITGLAEAFSHEEFSQSWEIEPCQ